MAHALDKCAVDYEARAALGAPPTAAAVDTAGPRLVDAAPAPRPPRDDDVASSMDSDDDDGDADDFRRGDHFSNLECVKMWNSRVG